MSESLSIGTIVEVWGIDCVHNGMQGQVVGFKDYELVRVWFGREADHLIEYSLRDLVRNTALYSTEPPPPEEQKRDLRTWTYFLRELVVCDSWNEKTLTERSRTAR